MFTNCFIYYFICVQVANGDKQRPFSSSDEDMIDITTGMSNQALQDEFASSQCKFAVLQIFNLCLKSLTSTLTSMLKQKSLVSYIYVPRSIWEITITVLFAMEHYLLFLLLANQTIW